jgi:cell division protein FtsI (penicillin-binding protein 3)
MNKENSLTTTPVGHNGLERAYEVYLKGKEGISYKQNLLGRWVTRSEIDPQNGMDLITTINVKMQDIVESALLRQSNISHPDWATAVLMDVKTGAIKAIANLGSGKNGYWEKDNYALGYRGCYEPGSTFKLVSLMAALEDGVVDTSDVFETGNGYWAKENIYDDHACGKVTVKEILEHSSNIGTAKVILTKYKTTRKHK